MLLSSCFTLKRGDLLPSGAGHGSTNVTWTMEFRCALWDSYATTPEESVRHVFAENQVIHVGPKFNDREPVASDEASPFRHNCCPWARPPRKTKRAIRCPTGSAWVPTTSRRPWRKLRGDGLRAICTASWSEVGKRQTAKASGVGRSVPTPLCCLQGKVSPFTGGL